MKIPKQSALSQYRVIGAQAGIEDASAHRLVQLLLQGGLARISSSIGHLKRRDVAAKGANVSAAIAIIGDLQGSLNLDQGGQIAQQLDELYDYMSRRLFEANSKNDAVMLEEVYGLLLTLKQGWDAIPNVAARQAESADPVPRIQAGGGDRQDAGPSGR